MEFFDYDKVPLDEKEIETLFKAAFNRQLDTDYWGSNYWQWRFKDNPSSDKLYISYAKEDGILVAYYAVSPIAFSVNGENKKVALSMMTMTHPNFSGKGLFRKLAKRVYQNLKEDGFYGVYGFANTNSHYNLRKHLNWQDLNCMITLKYSLANKKEGDTYKHEIIKNNDLGLIEKLFECSKIRANRSREFLKWRLIDNPVNNYYLFKCEQGTQIIYKRYNNQEIDVVDYVGSDENFFSDFKKFTLKVGNTYDINIWINLHTNQHLELEKLRYKPDRFNSYLGFIPLNSDDFALQYKNWRITMLDSDIF